MPGVLPPASFSKGMKAALIITLVILSTGVSGRAALSRLRVSDNHRYLQDADGHPFFLVGDSPQIRRRIRIAADLSA